MGLFDKQKLKEEIKPLNYTNPIASKILQRRLQILVHSYIYYELDDNIINDNMWSKWAMELVKLQKDNPIIASKLPYAKDFLEFDGSTGFNLPYKNREIIEKANRLLRWRDENNTRI